KEQQRECDRERAGSREAPTDHRGLSASTMSVSRTVSPGARLRRRSYGMKPSRSMRIVRAPDSTTTFARGVLPIATPSMSTRPQGCELMKSNAGGRGAGRGAAAAGGDAAVAGVGVVAWGAGAAG